MNDPAAKTRVTTWGLVGGHLGRRRPGASGATRRAVLTRSDGDELVVTSARSWDRLRHRSRHRRRGLEDIARRPQWTRGRQSRASSAALSSSRRLPSRCCPAPMGASSEPRRPRRQGLRHGRDLPGRVNEAADLNRAGARVDFAEVHRRARPARSRDRRISGASSSHTLPLGAVTISNDLLFTTLFDGRLVAHSLEDGSPIWSARLPVRDELAGLDRRRCARHGRGVPTERGPDRGAGRLQAQPLADHNRRTR